MIPFWQKSTWREIFSLDRDPAEAEGLAAGTGILTGDLAGGSGVSAVPCTRCGSTSAVSVETIDLVIGEVTRRCGRCALVWTRAEPSGRARS